MGGQEGGVMGGGREVSVDSSFRNFGSERGPHCRQPGSNPGSGGDTRAYSDSSAARQGGVEVLGLCQSSWP